MGTRPRIDVRRIALAGSASIVMALALAGPASAHSGHPVSISATVSGSSVEVSGTWSWKASGNDSVPSYVGYAISWGDVTSGNDVGSYHIGDGTAATNVVLQPTSPDQGTSGSWGPVSHVYAAPGTYTVCSIIYDLGEVKPFPASGQESLVAGGPNRNPDNSVDNGYEPGAQCTRVEIAADPTATATATATATPTETPAQDVAGATAVASLANTPPPTSTADSTDGTGGAASSTLLAVLALWAAFGAMAVRFYALQRRRS